MRFRLFKPVQNVFQLTNTPTPFSSILHPLLHHYNMSIISHSHNEEAYSPNHPHLAIDAGVTNQQLTNAINPLYYIPNARDFASTEINGVTFALLNRTFATALWWALTRLARAIVDAAHSEMPDSEQISISTIHPGFFSELGMPVPAVLGIDSLEGDFNPLNSFMPIEKLYELVGLLQLAGRQALEWMTVACRHAILQGTLSHWTFGCAQEASLIDYSEISDTRKTYFISGRILSYWDTTLAETRELVLHPTRSRYALAHPNFDAFCCRPHVDNGYTASKYLSLTEEVFGTCDSDDSEMMDSDDQISLAHFPSTVSLTTSPSSTLVNIDDDDVEMDNSMKVWRIKWILKVRGGYVMGTHSFALSLSTGCLFFFLCTTIYLNLIHHSLMSRWLSLIDTRTAWPRHLSCI